MLVSWVFYCYCECQSAEGHSAKVLSKMAHSITVENDIIIECSIIQCCNPQWSTLYYYNGCGYAEWHGTKVLSLMWHSITIETSFNVVMLSFVFLFLCRVPYILLHCWLWLCYVSIYWMSWRQSSLHNYTQHSNKNAIWYCYPEIYNAECHHVECRGAKVYKEGKALFELKALLFFFLSSLFLTQIKSILKWTSLTWDL